MLEDTDAPETDWVVDEILSPTDTPIVYFVTAKRRDYPVKIGRSSTTSLWKRLRDLQTAMPYELEVLFLMEGAGDQERNAHQAFADLRLSGEWFARDDDLLRVIADMAKTFPDWRDLAIHVSGRCLAITE